MSLLYGTVRLFDDRGRLVGSGETVFDRPPDRYGKLVGREVAIDVWPTWRDRLRRRAMVIPGFQLEAAGNAYDCQWEEGLPVLVRRVTTVKVTPFLRLERT